MTVVKRGEAKLPPRKRKTVQVDEIGGEVVLQALSLTDTLEIGLIAGDFRLRVPRILSAGVLSDDMKPLWTEEEWTTQFGSVEENRLLCFDLAMQILALSQTEKKPLPQTSDSPSESAA